MCCTVKEKSTSKSLAGLKKEFPIVEVEQFEKYQLLTIKENSKRKTMDYVIYLQLKLKNTLTTKSSGSSNEDIVEGVCKKLLYFTPSLKSGCIDKDIKLSLFEEEEVFELEAEPESPKGGEDNKWSSYFNKCEKVRARNLNKQYSFFELFKTADTYYIYEEKGFTHKLPKDSEAMIELVKEAIVKGTTNKEDYLNDESFEWDDEYNYIQRDGNLSDMELMLRVKMLIRLELVPYIDYFSVNPDDSLCSHEREDTQCYKYWFDGNKIIGSHFGNEEFPEYEIHTEEFISWLREHFNMPQAKSVISDDEILKLNIVHYFNSMLGRGRDEYDIVEKINNSKDSKEFRLDIFSFMKSKGIDRSNGGGSGVSLDGFRGGYGLNSDGNITVCQSKQERIQLGRDIELPDSRFRSSTDVDVWNLGGNEIYDQAFRLLSDESLKTKTSLFDFDFAQVA